MNPPPPPQPDPADRAPQDPADDAPQDSILGSLPRSRPSVRSPRRDMDQAARARRAAASKPKARSRRAEPRRTAAQASSPGSEAEDVGGVEEIAKAGVTTAVQVATAGLRFAGRAAGAIRESLERR